MGGSLIIKKNCKICNNEFFIKPYRIETAKYCSLKCLNIDRKGKHFLFNNEFKIGTPKENHPRWKGGKPKCINCGKVLSAYKNKQCRICYLKNKPLPKSIFKKGHIPWHKGKKGLQKAWNKGLPNDKQPNWKNGISKVKGYKRSKRLNIGLLTLKTIQLVYEDNIKQYGTLTCYLCLKPIEFRKDHLEHKIPVSRGGTNEYNNLAIACRSCNCRKSNKTPEEFLQYLEEKK